MIEIFKRNLRVANKEPHVVVTIFESHVVNLQLVDGHRLDQFDSRLVIQIWIWIILFYIIYLFQNTTLKIRYQVAHVGHQQTNIQTSMFNVVIQIWGCQSCTSQIFLTYKCSILKQFSTCRSGFNEGSVTLQRWLSSTITIHHNYNVFTHTFYCMNPCGYGQWYHWPCKSYHCLDSRKD